MSAGIQGAPGPVGPPGLPGPTGPQGTQGVTGPAPTSWSSYPATSTVNLSNYTVSNASNIYATSNVTLCNTVGNAGSILSDGLIALTTSNGGVNITFNSNLYLYNCNTTQSGYLSINSSNQLCWNGNPFTAVIE